MAVTVRYMAQLRSAAGVASESIDLRGPCTSSELAAQLVAQHGESLRRLLVGADGRISPFILVFVGDTQVGPDEPLSLEEGAVITLLSPVAGG
jgi:molybdopterin converting factor small subunit